MSDYEDYYRSQGLVPNADGTEWVKPSWVDQNPISNPDASPADIAAYRLAAPQKRKNTLPVADDRGSPFSGPANPERPSYVMEPDLQELQGGQQFPPGLMQEDSGRLYYQDDPTTTVPMIRRPGLLPVAATPEGIKFVTPKLLDLVGNVMGNVAAPRVAAKAGEMVLGSGLVRTAQEAKAAEPFYSQLERTVKDAKINLATSEQWTNYLRNQPGVKSEELSTVLGNLPKEGMLSKAELENYVKQNKVSLKEKVLGSTPTEETIDHYTKILLKREYPNLKEDSSEYKSLWDDARSVTKQDLLKYPEYSQNTKYHQYQLPGGENYKEMLLSLPVKLEGTTGLTMNDIAKRLGYSGWHSSLTPEQIAEVEKAFATQKMGPTAYHKRIEEIDEERANLAAVRDKKTNRIKEEAKWHELSKEKENLEKLYKQSQENAGGYKAPHFDDNGTNLLAHIRMNDRNIEGKKSLHLEEIQSDWHQAGRKQGYKGEKEKLEPSFNAIEEKLMATNDEKMLGLPKVEDVLKTAVDKKIITKQEADTYKRYTDIENGKPVPDAPFKKSWDELALKRMLHKAANEGYDAISWTPGEAQALRYPDELRKKVSSIEWDSKSPAGSKQIYINGKKGSETYFVIDDKGIVTGGPTQAKGKHLSEVIGKQMSNDILNKTEGNIDAKDFVMGAEGMKSFYDKMLVDRANNLAKKYGSKVEQKNLESGFEGKILKRPQGDGYYISYPSGSSKIYKTSEEVQEALKIAKTGQPIHYLPITPELRQKAKEGFPLFSSSPVYVPVDHDPFKDDKKKYKLVPIATAPEF